jgi:hypothetical protein
VTRLIAECKRERGKVGSEVRKRSEGKEEKRERREKGGGGEGIVG